MLQQQVKSGKHAVPSREGFLWQVQCVAGQGVGEGGVGRGNQESCSVHAYGGLTSLFRKKIGGRNSSAPLKDLGQREQFLNLFF